MDKNKTIQIIIRPINLSMKTIFYQILKFEVLVACNILSYFVGTFSLMLK